MANKSIIPIACITVFLAQLGITLPLPALPVLYKVFGHQTQEIALSLSAFLVGMATPMLVWGYLVDRYGRKPILLLALALYATCCVCITLIKHVDTFIVLRFIQGIGASGMSVISRIIIRDNFNRKQLAKSLSWLSIAFVASLGVGQYLGALLLMAFGWQAIFLSLALATFSLLLLVIPLPRFTSPMRDIKFAFFATCRAILCCRGFLMPTLAGGFGYGVIITFNTCAPFIFQGNLGWSSTEYGWLGWPISLCYLVGAWFVNRWVTAKGHDFLLIRGTGILLMGSAAMLLGGVLQLSWLIWLPYCVILIGQGINYPISMTIANEKAPHAGPYPMALCGFIHQLMAATIGALASLLSNQAIWMTCALICLLVIATVITSRQSLACSD